MDTNNNNNRPLFNIKDLLAELAKQPTETTNRERTPNTAKLYAEKINICCDSIEDGTKYAVRVINNTVIIYEDKNGRACSNGKISLPSAIRNNTEYLEGFEAGKRGKNCREYAVYTETETDEGGAETTYILINLNQFKKKQEVKNETLQGKETQTEEVLSEETVGA